jgi:hypothetical protein
MRRLLSVVALLLAINAGMLQSVAAQATPDAAPTNPFADLGLTQLDITVTDTAFEGLLSAAELGSTGALTMRLPLCHMVARAHGLMG